MDNKPGWISNLVTKRATVMTPILILNALLLFFGTLVYYRSGNFILFGVWFIVLVYTLYRHEKWSRKSPWLLAPQQVAVHGMDLFGTSEKPMTTTEVMSNESITNPNQKLITATKKKVVKK